MASPGRRKELAPPGHMTVREAADRLGVTRQAIRQRIDRGTLAVSENVITEGGERRYYIPEAAIERAVAEKNLPATKGDTGEVELKQDAILNELREYNREIREIRQERREQHHELREGQKALEDQRERQHREMMESVERDRRESEEFRKQMLEVVSSFGKQINDNGDMLEEMRRPWYRRWFGG